MAINVYEEQDPDREPDSYSMRRPLPSGKRSFYVCDWIPASLPNRWLLRMRLDEARKTHGQDAQWVETREMPEAPGQMPAPPPSDGT